MTAEQVAVKLLNGSVVGLDEYVQLIEAYGKERAHAGLIAASMVVQNNFVENSPRSIEIVYQIMSLEGHVP